MTVSDPTISRNEALVTEVLKIIDILPSFVPFKGGIQEELNNLRSVMQGLRPPRIMVIGRCRSGKSSLINAVCGLKVAKVSDVEPETGRAEWKEYYHHGTDLVHILDTRGLQEAKDPRQADSANTPYESIMQAVRKECPDVILVLCEAGAVNSASTEDLNICQQIFKEIKGKHHRELPTIGVLSKCDQLAPPMVTLPTNNERKNRNVEKAVQDFYKHLTHRESIRRYVKGVVPTAAYAEYEEGENGLILPDQDYRWNITELVEEIIKYTPRETRGSLARMAHLQEFQLSVANTVVAACVAICGVVSINPIPGTSIPVVVAIQSFMVTYIGWLSGREFSEETVKDFVVTAGVGVGANFGTIGIGDIALKFVPGFGSLLSAGAGAIATKGLGDAAIVYFLKNSSL